LGSRWRQYALPKHTYPLTRLHDVNPDHNQKNHLRGKPQNFYFLVLYLTFS
jgi:hypothetical protein